MKRSSIIHLGSASAALALTALACSAAPVESTGASGEAISAVPPSWAGWEDLQGGLVTDPVIVSDSESRLQVYATAPGGTVWERTYQPAIHLGAWSSNWVSLGNKGNAVGAPNAVAFNGQSEIFVRDSVTGHLLHQEAHASSSGVPTWNAAGWEDLGGSLAPGKPAVVVSQPGNQVNVFATMTDGTVGTIAIQTYGSHKSWVSLSGGALYEPGVTSWGADRLDVFVAGGDHGLYHRYSNDNGTTWYPSGTAWEDVGGSVGATPSVTSWAAGRLDIVATSPAGAIEHLAWLGPAWSAWSPIPGQAWTDSANGVAAPTSLSTGAGNLNVFIQEGNRALYVASVSGTDAAGNPSWSPFTQFASCFATAGSASVVSPDNNALDVAVTAFDPSGNANVWHAVTTGSALTFSGLGASAPPACACGGAGEPCCDNDACGSFSYCGAATLCIACGGPDEAPCPSSAACEAGLSLTSEFLTERCEASTAPAGCKAPVSVIGSDQFPACVAQDQVFQMNGLLLNSACGVLATSGTFVLTNASGGALWSTTFDVTIPSSANLESPTFTIGGLPAGSYEWKTYLDAFPGTTFGSDALTVQASCP